MTAAVKESAVYRRIVNAWCMYDWANSAFATTILAAVLPVYYSQVAGATLPSEARATAYWSLGLTISLLIVAILSPILGTVSDVMRGKKRFLAIFAGIGILGTAALVLISTGDWLLASILAILGRIGFNGSITFYDALLPHVAVEGDRDRVSARGFALGYLGGGILLAVNVAMIQFLPGTWGARLSFLSVAIWWAVFSIPLFRHVPEPPSATARLAADENVISVSLKRLGETLKDIRRYRELFKYLIAFLIYNDGIGTIIGVAAIYGAELGFGSVELILALLLVQFVAGPYSLIFGSLPVTSEGDPAESSAARRRPVYLAFILFSLLALPVVGIGGRLLLPGEITGGPLPAYQATASAVGEGVYAADSTALVYTGSWQRVTVPAKELHADQGAIYATTMEGGAQLELPFNGQKVEILYSTGPDQGIWTVEMDGQPPIDQDTGKPLTIDGYTPTVRYGTRRTFQASAPGEHSLSLVNSGDKNPNSQGTLMSLAEVQVLPPIRKSNLGLILGLVVGLEAVGLLLSWLVGRPLFDRWANRLDTRTSIILALVVYAVIAIWGFFLDSVIEFWFLAWMVAVVQGGSQALSRSLYATMSPAAKSGEFFGLFAIMEKFSSLIGPLLFAGAALAFNSSRPAVLSLIVLFFIGIFLLTKVNVDEGRRVAQQEDLQAGLTTSS
jgi:UMF1 family MFS transporter